MPSAKGWTDRGLEEAVGRVLRGGVAAAAAVVAAGGAIYLARHHGDAFGLASFAGEPASYTSVPGILRSAAGLGGRGIVQLGLLLLIATPVARVALSVVGFALERDGLYSAVTLLVLAFLLYSLGAG